MLAVPDALPRASILGMSGPSYRNYGSQKSTSGRVRLRCERSNLVAGVGHLAPGLHVSDGFARRPDPARAKPPNTSVDLQTESPHAVGVVDADPRPAV